MAHTPQAKYRKDYQSPSHTISQIDLTFDLYDSASIITAVSSVKQERDSSTLVLDGEGLKLVSVVVEGNEWTQYELSETQLILNALPKDFTLTIVTEVNPEGNSALEGLYKSGGAFCTQCEAEGFRRITYYMDRPDVLAKFTTTVIADKAENPFLLSNGNRVDQGEAENGRHWVKWQDPHPKPAYLFALDAFRGVLLSDSLEPAFIAEMLSLPSHNEVSGWYDRVDIDAVASVLNAMKVTLAKELEDELSAVYHSHALTEYTIDHDSIGKRTLRKVCLSYLAHTEQGNDLVVTMYQQANNMTDTMAAMGAANSAQLACRETLMADYSDKWKRDGLVMDKWFALQGTNPSASALDVIKASMSHQAFSLKNPNRTRNLVGSFLNMNPVQFHDKSGQGYAFAGEILRELNSSNPQVASRLIDPLLKFRKYDDERQALIIKELETLKNMDNLAKDLFEKVNKALEA
ncbi:aminopeptidase N C-terminal domain-containing protein [Vibrio cyclitrophicus]|uniref:Aminopeptidase N C-terminal domain-containing protein n=1 Tax=Vibrio cyclitrophicus ZF270 TaxID=1136176 RepID=A0AAN0NBK7_9VIBR